MRSRWTADARAALLLYALLAIFPFIWSAFTWDGFWRSVAPFSTLLAIGILVALWRGHRWAWVVLVALDLFILVSYIWDPADAVALVVTLLRLALLLSPPVRSFVGRGDRSSRDYRPRQQRRT